MAKNRIKEAARLMKESRRTYVLSGAGMSTESGIPDFRSPQTGLWEKVDPVKTSSVDALTQDPELFYRSAFKRYSALLEAEPNTGHYILAEMEQLGIIRGVITQNIDGLHKMAGTKKLFEVHGHVRTCRCMSCGKRHSMQDLLGQLDEEIIPPKCSRCPGILRPDIVLFGDPMATDYFAASEALQTDCDLLVVVGSSLSVYPVASMPGLVKDLIIINLQPTPFDHRAQVVIREKSGTVLSQILDYIKNQS
jgi:NAD-dependent deacetylase